MDNADLADLKIIPDELVNGTSGETLVAARAQAMGFLFHPPGRLEAGIIELRDPTTKGLTSDLIGVQSKATDNGFKNDDGQTFTFNVDARDHAFDRAIVQARYLGAFPDGDGRYRQDPRELAHALRELSSAPTTR